MYVWMHMSSWPGGGFGPEPRVRMGSLNSPWRPRSRRASRRTSKPPRWRQMAPGSLRQPKIAPRTPQERTRCPQEAPRGSQEVPKKHPRRPQEADIWQKRTQTIVFALSLFRRRWAPGVSRPHPRGLQGIPRRIRKSAERPHQPSETPMKPARDPKMLLRARLAPILAPFPRFFVEARGPQTAPRPPRTWRHPPGTPHPTRESDARAGASSESTRV